jgi:hypothetical protein
VNAAISAAHAIAAAHVNAKRTSIVTMDEGLVAGVPAADFNGVTQLASCRLKAHCHR